MSTGQPIVNRGCGYRRFAKRNTDLIETAHNVTSCPHVRFTSLLVFGNNKTPVRSYPAPELLPKAGARITAKRRVDGIEAFARAIG
jgi:hypothetical protein